jgi:hypothetical protein
LYWGLLNYRICKESTQRADISPMRTLAMSVFANQFGAAHAILFAQSLFFQVTLPVIKTLRPPDVVLTFSAIVGFLLVYLLVTLVAWLTVWWHVQLARFVYGDGSPRNAKAGVAIGLLFAGTGVWIVANLGTAQFYTLAPAVANLCYIPVFLIARSMFKQNVNSGAPVEVPQGTPESNSNRLTLEWLLVLVYGTTVFFCGPATETYSALLVYFSGLPMSVWLVYLFRERQRRGKFRLTKEATNVSS